VNLWRGLSNLAASLQALSSLTTRTVIREAWRIERALPQWLNTHTLPELMQRLDNEASATLRSDEVSRLQPEATEVATMIVRLADAAVGLDYFSPLGICLRRSLVRYVLLRRAGVPVVVHFGAKKNTRDGQNKIAGHAWLTLAGEPYAENPADYQGFTAIYVYPSVTA
jgi:hypothetical protein